ncbi:ribonuclease G [Polynucleobacter sp. SHI8]|uniref:ribonuclease G n=1 Tax=unclassified Polynucleobacter TaxID=2640945 RepID=UPI002491FEAC|nr:MULTISPECIES: ribonuclease G [unclassified Polynucleobacter]BDW10453.1 ribonuclease G [Polynucleobacter sp. SHI2]BDW12899.1 ribonuclease G [Polynucleobacter sp. SHI8]
MNEEILINFTPQETRVALVQHGEVQELLIERAQNLGILGNVYLGKVVRVLPGMQSAFVDIGLEKSAFIHVADINNGADMPIEKLVFDGQTILVQVLKDPLGTKGARLTTHISIAGRNLVYLPLDEKNGQIGISQRITDEAERDRLKQRLRSILPEELKGCLIMRTSAEEASDRDLEQDLNYLLLTWSRIHQQTLTKPTPSKIYEELNLIERVMRDIAEESTTVIRIDSAENCTKLQQFAATYMPKLVDKIQLYRGERPLFDLFDVENEINLALNRRVNLKSGGYLMIDQTESMTTVDVNTGSYIGAKTFVDTIYKTNLEAAKAIARQLRLRNLGGIIIVDFIDMHTAEHQTAVLSELNKSLALDRMKTTVNQFSNLGLVEMTRKRTRESLAHQLCEPCPVCEGKGEVKTAQTICYEILREIVREHRQFNPKEFRIVASPDVIDLFLEEQSQFLAELGEFIGKPIRLRSEGSFAQEHYDIVLL